MTKADYKGIWVFAETCGGRLADVVPELLAKAQELKAHCGETVTAVLLGSMARELPGELIARGADQVIVAEDAALETYSARPYQQAMTQLAEKYHPSIILYGATSVGRDLAPRIMVSLQTGLTADAIDLGFDEDDVFYQTTPGYGGKLLAHIVIPERRPQMATVHPQSFVPLQPDASRTGEVIYETVQVSKDAAYELLNRVQKTDSGTSIDRAAVLVSGGRGVKTEKDLALLRELAVLLGGQVSGSRPLVDSGLLPHDAQIGQSGKTVTPDVIINVAVSGSIQYRTGMQNAKTILSINQNANAPIFDLSHYGAVADFRALLPALIQALQKRKTQLSENNLMEVQK